MCLLDCLSTSGVCISIVGTNFINHTIEEEKNIHLSADCYVTQTAVLFKVNIFSDFPIETE